MVILRIFIVELKFEGQYYRTSVKERYFRWIMDERSRDSVQIDSGIYAEDFQDYVAVDSVLKTRANDR